MRDEKKESKLDKWIKQNIIGEHRPEEKIIHEPAPAVQPGAKQQPAQKPQQTQPAQKPGQAGNKPHAAHPQKPSKKGFFFGRHKKGPPAHPGRAADAPAHAQPAHAGQRAPAHAPHAAHFQRTPASFAQQPAQAPQRFHGKLRIIALGGLDEVGKNCMALEYGAHGAGGPTDIILIDLGFQFPDEDMLGVDYVIPDISYLQDKLDRIRGIVFTHGHLDHIGAVPYLVQKLGFPLMFGTRLTMGLVDKRLEEFGLQKEAKVKIITAEDTLQLGAFNISFFRVNHSIPDAVGVVVKTPAGNIVHTGDFKFDFTPSGDQKPADFARIASLANQNIAALFIDSTNALKPGYTVSEKKIGDSLESIIKNIEGRILIASFASQIGRMQQIINFAK